MTRTLDGIALTDDQVLGWQAILRETGGNEGVADMVFALCHVHDSERWVPLDLFEMVERDSARQQSGEP